MRFAAFLVFAADSLLQGEPVHKLCSKLFGEAGVDALRKKYRFLFELYQSPSIFHGTGIFEFLLHLTPERFSLAALRDLLSGMEAEELIRRYVDVEEDVFLYMRQALADGDESGGFFGESSYYFTAVEFCAFPNVDGQAHPHERWRRNGHGGLKGVERIARKKASFEVFETTCKNKRRKIRRLSLSKKCLTTLFLRIAGIACAFRTVGAS